jgi:hypothetical protein
MGDLAEEADRINSGKGSSSSSTEASTAAPPGSKSGRRQGRKEEAAMQAEHSEDKKQLTAHLSQLR